MGKSAATTREIALPASVFDALRDELSAEAGTLQTVRALHHAGYHAGLSAALVLNHEVGGDAYKLSPDRFWNALSGYFEQRGWGSLKHETPHRAVGILRSTDWAEARPEAGQTDGTCSFSSGFLSGLLSQIVGGPIAVLEVSCRTRRGDSCAFAFGSETAIHDLYGKLLDGADLDSALAEL